MSDNIKLGSKVEIIGKDLCGVVSYYGSTSFASGKWIGVTLNKPLGKNDGEVQGKRYFSCDPNSGVFVRPAQVKVLESPPMLRKLGDDVKATSPGSSFLPTPNRGERSSSPPSRLSRLQAPSSLQKPKSRLSFAPKTRPASIPDQTPAPEERPEPVAAPPPKPDLVQPSPVPVEEPPLTKTTPEPSLVSTLSTTSVTTFAPGVSMVEIESLKGQIKEWKEKYDTIRIKRQEDRSKLKDFEKMRIQMQHLQDGKARSSEQIQDLSKQVRDAKKATDEAIEARERYMDEMSDVHETIEMATLDKEMAEEKADIYQKEAESLKEKVEELQTDLEIMKAEMEDEGSEGAAGNYQVKQLTEQNNKFKEALVRLRDLSTAEKAEYHALEKQMGKKTKELHEMTQKKEKLEMELEMTESTVDELKEQVDAALGAEEMVEMLTDKNLAQEEKLVDMEEQMHDLESINEMNEELQENARETELELREEADLMRAKVHEAQRRTEAANEVVADYQDTIQKFRKVVQDLQDANQELRSAQSEQEEKSDTDKVETQPPAFNYQIKMVETKAAARSIDHEIRKLDLAQANLRAGYLQMYMPNSTTKGGDHDSMEVLLFVKRLSSKAQIIAKHISDKFDLTSEADEEVELLGVRGDQLTFATSLVSKLENLHVLMDSYDEALSKCSVDLLLKVGTLYREMLSYEQILNLLSDMLRKDTLDETTNTDSLHKLVQFFQHLFNVHLSREELNSSSLLERSLCQIQTLYAAISLDARRLKTFMQPGHETSDATILLKDIATSCDDLKRFCKKVKRRIQQTDVRKSTLEIPQEVKDKLAENVKSLTSIHMFALNWVKDCVKINRPTDTSTLMASKMLELLKNSASQVFEGQDGCGTVRTSFADVIEMMSSLLTSMQEGEYDATTSANAIQAPIERRAVALKAEMVDSEGLTSKLEEKDAAIKELRRVAKLKGDDVAELKIRIGMLERKLEKSVKEGNEKTSLLQQRLDAATEDLKKREKKYDETLDALQSDIDTLEAEKAELKKRLALQAKQRNVLTDIAFKSPEIGAAIPGVRSEIASILTSAPGPTKITDSPLLSQQIQVLRNALRGKTNECSRLAGEKMLQDLKTLTPLKGLEPRNDSKELVEVRNKLNKLSTALDGFAIPKVIDISKRRPGRYPVGSGTPYHTLFNQQCEMRALDGQLQDAGTQLHQAVAKSTNLEVKSDFTQFPVPQLAKSLSIGDPQLIGRLDLNTDRTSKPASPGKSDLKGGQKLYLELDQLDKLHELMLKRSISYRR